MNLRYMTCFAVFLIGLMFVSPAHAYFDPGIAAFVYQVGYGLVTAALVLLISGPKRVWLFCKSLFCKTAPETPKENIEE